MATKVLDSWALMALFNEEPASEAVEKLLHAATAGKHTLLLSVINWGEIYYTTLRRGGESAATAITDDISQMPITLVPVETANLELIRQAAIFKATKKLSYADCFAAALAKLRRAEFVTGDPEFKVVDGEIRISWLTNAPSKGPSLANHQIVTLAVYLLGGETKQIDTEDIAVKANALAPGRFSWRKYPAQINIETVRAFLSDAKKTKNGSYLSGVGKDGWLLTEAGLRFARGNVNIPKAADLSRNRITAKERKRIRTEKERMLSTSAFAKFDRGETASITSQEAEAFFRLDAYVQGAAREQKIARAVNIFGSDEELGEATKTLATHVRKKKV